LKAVGNLDHGVVLFVGFSGLGANPYICSLSENVTVQNASIKWAALELSRKDLEIRVTSIFRVESLN